MAIDFPDSPFTGQTFSVSGTTWTYDGQKWNITSTPITGPQGAQGPGVAVGGSTNQVFMWVGTLSAGTKTIMVRAKTSGGNTAVITGSAAVPSYVLCEDIGPAGAPT